MRFCTVHNSSEVFLVLANQADSRSFFGYIARWPIDVLFKNDTQYARRLPSPLPKEFENMHVLGGYFDGYHELLQEQTRLNQLPVILAFNLDQTKFDDQAVSALWVPTRLPRLETPEM